MSRPERNDDNPIRVIVREARAAELPPPAEPPYVGEVLRLIWDDEAFRIEGCRMHISITMVDMSGANG